MHLNLCNTYNVTGIIKMKKQITQPFSEISSWKLLQGLTLRMSWTCFLRLLKKNSKSSEIFPKKLWRQIFCHIFFFLILKIQDSSFVAPLILRHIMPKIGTSSNTVSETTFSQNLTLHQNRSNMTSLWRHFRPTCDRYDILFLVRMMCKIDAPESTESLVPISLFVWKISRKNERGALNSPPSQSRVK